MKSITLLASILSIFLAFSCAIEEPIPQETLIKGTWINTAENDNEETVKTVFNIGENTSFSSYTETCTEDDDCETEEGQDAKWALVDEKFYLTYSSINITNKYSVLELTEEILILERNGNTLIFRK